jgi:hypothetical protein
MRFASGETATTDCELGEPFPLLSGCTLEALERAVAMGAAPAPPAPAVVEVSP